MVIFRGAQSCTV